MTAINQKEYLKKYLGIGKKSHSKKKKIKSEKVLGKSLKIIDDDVDSALSKEIQEDLANLNEDAPQIVAVIDDRPPSMRIDEKTKDNLWMPIGQVTPSESRGDISPPRKISSQNARDMSPARKVQRDIQGKCEQRDESRKSPPKRKHENSSHARKSRWNQSSSRNTSEEDNSSQKMMQPERMEKTLSGKKSGLQNAKDLAQEIIIMKEKEEELFKNMSNEVSGQNAMTISRKKKLTTPEEDVEKKRTEKEMEVKYSKWGKGIKQVQDNFEKNEEMLHEMSKPLARYADDEDLEKYLKEQEREGDPMLLYIKKKKKKKQIEAGIPEKPSYMGDFEPNRFGIPPGYRWDGVDRSNGYEKKLFESKNSKKADEEEFMKWNTEDM